MYLNTHLKPIDNSQIKTIKIINYKSKKIKIGTFFVCIIKKLTNKFKFNKKNIFLGLITTLKFWNYRFDNSLTYFHTNGCVITDVNYKLLSNKIQKPVSKTIFVQNHINKLAFKKLVTFLKTQI